ncbi:hemolysin family protein [Bogoriella caseilytica]|uniref:CBS domain containing-hemolysin-like protein n=1 Tax=Bogoriella caseilytica TaxID=56055 RepID=A0A3N2BBE8_9MICO|nr:hemolysin family protein [Bogoriella caseilytica]ROR72581.1 CBS domain containing-hemolysin-like protein [Bogoriella caseilytica]
MTWLLSLLLGTVVILSVIAANGYFVAQEFAYMAVDRSRLAARAETGDKAAQRALRITSRTSFMLSGAQLGITVTGLLVGYVAEPLVGNALGDALGGVGVPQAIGVAVGTVLALAVSTIVQMLFGELVPKNLALARPEGVALWLSRTTGWYLIIFGWLIWIFDTSANALLRLLRIEPVHDVEHSATARDLERIVEDSRATGDLPADLSVLLDRILDFPDQDAEHAMIPRAQVDVVHASDTLGEVRKLMATSHSRFPVVDEDNDVVGVVHLTDFLAGEIDDDAPVTDLAREPLLVPTTMALPDALTELTTSLNQMAIVLDEYGGFTGVLTVEDVAEEIVGEITDEHDEPAEPPATLEEDGSWLIDGDVHVDEVERTLGHDLPEGDYETIAGLAIAAHGALPEAGDSMVVELEPKPAELAEAEPPPIRHLHLEVIEVERHVPGRLRMWLEVSSAPSPHSPGSPASAASPATPPSPRSAASAASAASADSARSPR